MRYKKPQLWIMIAAIAVCAVMAVCFLTNSLNKADAGTVSSKGDNGGSQPTEIGSIQESQPYEQPETDKVSIEGLSTGEAQKWLTEQIDALIEDAAGSMASSNPYDYIDNQYFNNIISGGIAVLPTITKLLASSENNGLREYILPIVAEEISKTQLRENGYTWSTAKEWLDKWNLYLQNIPTRVDDIVNDTEKAIEDKKLALNNLGVMSLPYIKDAIDAGHTEYQDLYNNLTGASESSSQTGKNGNITESDLKIIRNMVEEARAD